MKTVTLGIGLLLASSLIGLAESSTAAPEGPCSDSERAHDFDFWIGEWEVYSDGKLAGTNSIQPILDGCVLQEMWNGSGGSAGSSLNFYNPQLQQWQQLWVWRNGTTLLMAGGLVDGSMVLEGESVSRSGEPLRNRFTWTENADGTVRQHWEVSKDQGESWQTAFDGLYRKKP